MRNSCWLALVVASCAAPPTPADTEVAEVTPAAEVTLPCRDLAPRGASSEIVEVTITEGAEVPACDWTCDHGYEQHGGECLPLFSCIEGWCYENPFPQSAPILGGFVAGPGEVWAFPDTLNHALRYEAGRWRTVSLGTVYDTAIAAWGAAPDDVWAVALGSLRRWDGEAWLDATPDELLEPFTFDLVAIDGSAADDVWVVGTWLHASDQGLVVRWDGLGWTEVQAGIAEPAIDVRVRAAAEVYVLSAGTLYRWDGAAWAEAPFPGGEAVALELVEEAVAVVDIDGGLFWYADGTWVQDTAFAGSAPLWSDGAALVAGGAPVQRWDGAWHPEADALPGPTAIWGGGPDDRWLGGSAGEVHHDDGTGWASVTSGVRADWRAVTVVEDDEVWLVGDGALRWDGRAWVSVDVPHATTCTAAWGSEADGVFLGGPDAVVQLVDGAWRRVDDGVAPRVVAMDGVDGEVWTAGDGGRVLRIRDGAAHPVPVGGGDYVGVHVVGVGDAWLAPAEGPLERWDGDAQVAVGPDAAWVAMGGASERDVFALSVTGEMWRWDGELWTQQPLYLAGDRISVLDDDEIWLFSEDDRLAWRYGGVGWEAMLLPDVATVAFRRGGETLLAGRRGMVLRPE